MMATAEPTTEPVSTRKPLLDPLDRFEADDSMAAVIDRANQPWGGFTLTADLTEHDAETGYVATITSYEYDFAHELTRADVAALFREYRTVLETHPDHVCIGGFATDADEDYKSIDLNVWVPDKEKAVEIGKRFNQKSVWDLENEDTIPTGGTGEATVTDPDTVTEIVSELLE